MFIPGATVEDVLHTVSDPTGVRAHRQEDVLEARVLSRSPNGLRLFLKLQRRVIVSATYNTEHDVNYRAHTSGRASSRSVATRISEVANAGRTRRTRAAPRRGPRLLVGAQFVLALRSSFRWRAGGARVVDAQPRGAVGSRGGGTAAGRSVAKESITRTLAALRARFVPPVPARSRAG